uniref:Protein kintoun n=1 Tax=Glossina palpalis gambiensis TaxID=67801 RepID=A0A1B0BB13_9MUSC
MSTGSTTSYDRSPQQPYNKGNCPRIPHHKQAYGARDLDITKEEFQRISDALKNEEFRKLFMEYIDEIQDPENRKLYEEEIKQIEAERGVDVVFVNPEPGFVIKTSQDGDQKCFINCAKSPEVGKPSNEVCIDPVTGTRGLSWSIPMAQAPPRDDLDNKRKHCRVYDVVFHPDALYLSERNKAFRKCLVDTALDAVEREFKVTLDRVNLKFPKLQFKGIARPTVIRKLAKNPPPETDEPHPLESIYPAKPTADSGNPTVLPMKNMSTKVKKSEHNIPKYSIKHRRDVDLAEYTNELDAKLNVAIPRELVVEIELPLLNSSAECQLDVTEKSIFLLSDRAGAKYRLDLQLPYAVHDKEGNARFDIDTRRLIITLPVVHKSTEQQREMHANLLNLCREDSGVESDVREDVSTISGRSPVEEISDTYNIEHSGNSSSQEDSGEDQKSAETERECKMFSKTLLSTSITDASFLSTAAASPGNSSQSFLKPNIEYQLPTKFDCNVLDSMMCWVLHVRNVQPESLLLSQSSRHLHLQFASIGSGYYPSYYAFYIQLPDEYSEAQILKVDAEAWENNVVLNLHLNVSAEDILTYFAGLEGGTVKEYKVQEKLQVAHKSRQRTKPACSSAPLDVSIERSDCGEKLEIEIKASPNLLTTEEEEDATYINDGEDDAGNHQKKINKKQKRKNKKRRSLSESVCDDIKAYQQHQEALRPTPPVPEVNETAAVDGDDDEDSSPERLEKSSITKPNMNSSASVDVPNSSNYTNSTLTNQQRKQRSFSESRDSAISCSSGSTSCKGILKHYSRYEPRPSISDSCSSIEEYSSTYSTSVDGVPHGLDSLRFSQSFSDIPEENVSDNCKKTVRFSEVIKKQVFRMDSSILGQRKKNQKRRDRKLKALQRRLSEGDSADYEDNKMLTTLQTVSNGQYFENKTHFNVNNTNNNNNNNGNKSKYNNDSADDGCGGGDNNVNAVDNNDSNDKKMRSRLDSESSSDIDANCKNSLMFDMDL